MNCFYKSCMLIIFVFCVQYYFTSFFELLTMVSCIKICGVVINSYNATDFVKTSDINFKSSTDDFFYQTQKQVVQIDEIHDQRFSNHNDYRINDQLWFNEFVYQQLSLRFNQINQNLNVTNISCVHLQNALIQRKKKLTKITKRYELTNAFLKYEFKCHKKTKKNFAHERNVIKGLINFLNDVKLSETFKSNQIDVLFRKIQNIQQRLYDINYKIQILHDMLKSKENCIKTLKTEKNAAIAKLKKRIKILEQKIQNLKSNFLNFMSKGEDFSIEIATTTIIGKRKQAFICSIECAKWIVYKFSLKFFFQ